MEEAAGRGVTPRIHSLLPEPNESIPRSFYVRQVNFESVRFSVLGITLVQKDLSTVGIWRMSFLDDDFRILYAAGGKNVPKENIYILAK